MDPKPSMQGIRVALDELTPSPVAVGETLSHGIAPTVGQWARPALGQWRGPTTRGLGMVAVPEEEWLHRRQRGIRAVFLLTVLTIMMRWDDGRLCRARSSRSLHR